MLRWLLVLGLVGGIAGADPTANGFAHRIHDLKLTTAGSESLPCTSCHAMTGGRLVGKPDHATCFTAACHAPKPKSGKLCETCHAAAALAKPRPAVFYPPYSIDRDFRVELGHAKHASSVACTACHTAKPQSLHARCLGCHDGKTTFAMTKCEPCHAAASGDPRPPQLKPAFFKMSSFSHAKHGARSTAGKTCTTCHATIAESNEQFLPRPTAATCATAGCHDGTAAFAITVACTRCHADARTSVERPQIVRFSHQHHTAANLQCAACHGIAGTEVISTGHAACVTCHRADFGSQKPTICLACHSSIEPWRHLIVDRLPPPATEFGANLDHGKHSAPCASCHKLDATGHELRPPRGHAACNGCHLAAGGVMPNLGDCEACHRAGLQSERDITRRGAAWSVRQRFKHATHGAATCVECHIDMSAPDVRAIATPAKATCARCHEGRAAFDLTGTSCTRCHVGAL